MPQICLVMHVKDLITMKKTKTYTNSAKNPENMSRFILSLEEEEDNEDNK